MWKRLVAKWPTLNNALGKVLWSSPALPGKDGGTGIVVRIKWSADDSSSFVSLEMKPSRSYELNERTTCYLDLDVEAARKLQVELHEALQRLGDLDPPTGR